MPLNQSKTVVIKRFRRYYSRLKSLILEAALKKGSGHRLRMASRLTSHTLATEDQRGKRGRGAGEKIVVLGLLKRHGKVYTQILPDASQQEILPIIKATVRSGANIYS